MKRNKKEIMKMKLKMTFGLQEKFCYFMKLKAVSRK